MCKTVGPFVPCHGAHLESENSIQFSPFTEDQTQYIGIA